MNQVRDVRSMGESRTIPLRDLRLDPYNPRLPADVQGQSQVDLAVHLELGFDALTVAESIASHGYFGSEPLIVISDECWCPLTDVGAGAKMGGGLPADVVVSLGSKPVDECGAGLVL